MTTILTFDTTTQSCSVGLRCEEITYERFEYAPRKHSDLLLPMIDSVLLEAKIAPSDIDLIGITHGPGSFMGTRLAVGVAQGLAYAWACPIVTLSTLRLVAQTAKRLHGISKALPVWDARMNEVYWGMYEWDESSSQMLALQDDKLATPDVVNVNAEYKVVGNIDLPSSESHLACDPHAVDLLPLAASAFKAGTVYSALTVEPLYLRRAV